MTTYFVYTDNRYGFAFVRITGSPDYIRWELAHPDDAFTDVTDYGCCEVKAHQLPPELTGSPDYQNLLERRYLKMRFYKLTGRPATPKNS